jgi:hypothetical protein
MTLDHAVEITYLRRRLEYLAYADKALCVVPSKSEHLPDFLIEYSDVCSRGRLIELLESMSPEADSNAEWRNGRDRLIKNGTSVS